MNCRIALLPLLFLFSVANSASAQILYGSIVGKVTDPTGAAVVSAKVTITNKGTGFTRDAATDSSGTFEFPNVRADPTKSGSMRRASAQPYVPTCRSQSIT